MKKVLFLARLSIVTLVASSQRLRLNAYGGYVIDDGFESNPGPNTFFVGTICVGGQWSVGFEYLLRPNYSFEVHYLHQTTHVPYTYKLEAAAKAKSEDPILATDVRGTGTDLYTGTVAKNYGLSSYSGIYQFGLWAGATIKLGK